MDPIGGKDGNYVFECLWKQGVSEDACRRVVVLLKRALLAASMDNQTYRMKAIEMAADLLPESLLEP